MGRKHTERYWLYLSDPSPGGLRKLGHETLAYVGDDDLLHVLAQPQMMPLATVPFKPAHVRAWKRVWGIGRWRRLGTSAFWKTHGWRNPELCRHMLSFSEPIWKKWAQKMLWKAIQHDCVPSVQYLIPSRPFDRVWGTYFRVLRYAAGRVMGACFTDTPHKTWGRVLRQWVSNHTPAVSIKHISRAVVMMEDNGITVDFHRLALFRRGRMTREELSWWTERVPLRFLLRVYQGQLERTVVQHLMDEAGNPTLEEARRHATSAAFRVSKNAAHIRTLLLLYTHCCLRQRCKELRLDILRRLHFDRSDIYKSVPFAVSLRDAFQEDARDLGVNVSGVQLDQ